MDEATGKRIRRLSLAEPYPKSREIYLTIELDDETEILIEVECRPWFGIKYLVRGTDGELEPVKESMHGSIRSLAKGMQDENYHLVIFSKPSGRRAQITLSDIRSEGSGGDEQVMPDFERPSFRR
jgi:hypothetical protein